MAKAKVTLNDNGPLSWHGNGYSFERGQSALITKDSDIAFFLAEPGFTVDMQEGSRPKAAVVEDDEDEAPVAKPKKAAKPAKAGKSAPPPPADEDDDDAEDGDDEDSEGDEDEEADDDEADDGPADGKYTEADLKKLNKTSLMEIIDERKLKADASMKNKDLIAIILAADES